MFGKKLLIIRLIIAILLLQTLFYKFSAHPDSVYIFAKIGFEPIGRIGIGVLELISAILILNSRTIWVGALLTSIIIAGAITMHLTRLEIVINNDGGLLFYMALTVFLLSIIILINELKFKRIFSQKI